MCLLPGGTAALEHERPLCARGQRQWAIVVPIIFLEFMVICMSRTIIPELIDEQYGESSYVVYGSADGVRGLLAFLATPAFGALSDELGRKWLFLVAVVGTTSPLMILAFASRLDVYLAVWAMSGIFAATFPLAFAYISDHVPAPSLVQAYGITLGCGLGLAMMLGPISGALLASACGTRAVFLLSLLITLCNGGLAACFMREESGHLRSRHLGSREGRHALLRRANPFAAFAMLANHPPMRLLSAIVFFFYLALWGFVANNLLYCKRRFGFTREMSAGLLTAFGLVTVCTQSVGLRLLQRRLSEPQIVRLCFACAVLAFGLYGTASTAAPLYVAMVFLGISIGGMAVTSSLASQVVAPPVVGTAQGVLTAMKALTEGCGPLLVSSLLHAFEGSSLPGAPWLLCGASAALAAVLALKLEATIAAHAASSSVHAGGYVAEPLTEPGVEEKGLKLRSCLPRHGDDAAAGGESRDGLMQGTVASHTEAEAEQPAPALPCQPSASFAAGRR